MSRLSETAGILRINIDKISVDNINIRLSFKDGLYFMQHVFLSIQIIGILQGNYISRSQFYSFVHGIINTQIGFTYNSMNGLPIGFQNFGGIVCRCPIDYDILELYVSLG